MQCFERPHSALKHLTKSRHRGLSRVRGDWVFGAVRRLGTGPSAPSPGSGGGSRAIQFQEPPGESCLFAHGHQPAMYEAGGQGPGEPGTAAWRHEAPMGRVSTGRALSTTHTDPVQTCDSAEGEQSGRPDTPEPEQLRPASAIARRHLPLSKRPSPALARHVPSRRPGPGSSHKRPETG
jgi:hypothetical protein